MLKIIIIDDEKKVYDELSVILKNESHEVAYLSDASQAIEAIKFQKPDLVICDVVMPNYDGISLLKEIRKRFPSLKVIIISGGGPVNRADYYLSIANIFGCSDYMQKPIKKEALLACMDRIFKPKKAVATFGLGARFEP